MVDSTTISMNSNEPMPSPSLTKRIKDRLPTLEAVRKTTKVCISLLIGFIMNMDGTTKQAIGSGTLFVVITCLFYFPNRSLGVVLESIMYGTAGSLLSAAWCTLGMFLANLARNPLESEPIQAASSAVLAVFLFFGTFVVNYIRV
ncbi:uncharacterized protein BX664DRAFT_159280 [Halteromyces radiatus]|uniref:uncharacterized protein n=1 Tax=Halteromyces radiatus TaxID=101107 RepID=UPI00222001E4|nr:uncharacterized protein BX664DRAFT_159280 [Halteromyces radiatus]KAI8086521.1 hypothetical protein BX664DRAFT_159280 [Halteromyces radiatus]